MMVNIVISIISGLFVFVLLSPLIFNKYFERQERKEEQRKGEKK